MTLLADEGVDAQIVQRLRRDGHGVLYVAEMSPSISDDMVLEQAEARGALLVTADKDFGELVHRQGRLHAGVLLLRLAGLPSEAKAAAVAAVLREREAEIAGAFCVVSPGRLRIRRA
jgi:predicted nuclease of predicted toxin-antitoxin system